MSNELQVQSNENTQKIVVSAQNSLTATSDIYSSIVDDGSRASKVAIYNSMADPDVALSDCVNMEIEVVDIIAHNVTMNDENTGFPVEAMRVVLIDVNGKSYGTVSKGVFMSLKSIFNLVGQPSYKEDPLKIRVLQKGKAPRKFLTLELL